MAAFTALRYSVQVTCASKFGRLVQVVSFWTFCTSQLTPTQMSKPATLSSLPKVASSEAMVVVSALV